MKNKYKITIFGDSIPKGIVYENNQLKKLSSSVVDIIANHYNLDIENNSVYGQTLSRLNEKSIIDKYLSSISPTDRNVAVLSIGGNDADYNWRQVALSPNSIHTSKTPPDTFEQLLNQIIAKLRKHNVQVILTNIPPICSQKYFNNVISKTADKSKVLEFLQGDIDNIYRHQEIFNMIITKCASRNKCTLLDIRRGFLEDISYLNSFCEDGIHPNSLGHEKMAKSIINQLNI